MNGNVDDCRTMHYTVPYYQWVRNTDDETAQEKHQLDFQFTQTFH